MNPLFLLTLAAAVSMLVIPLARRAAPRLGLVDLPDARKVHTVPIPRIGGWGITLGTLLPLLLALPPQPLLLAYVIGTLILFAFGVWDDARTIGHWTKFVGQLAAAATVVYYGGMWVARLPFFDTPLPAAVGQPFTLFALVGVINAINHSDGLDGLAGGESILSLIALAILGYMCGNNLILSIALATVGGIFGFLRYNSHPAYVFMGDCGSQVLGFTLGFLVVLLTQQANTAVSAALPLLVLGVPLADILAVLYRRIRDGMHWFKATRNHIHHRLIQLGFDHYETVVIIYSFQVALVVSAVLARYESDLVVTLLYVLIITGLFGGIEVAARSHWHVPGARGMQSRLTRAITALKASALVPRVSVAVIAVGMLLVLLLTALWVRPIPADAALAAMLLALVTALPLLWPRLAQPALLRLAVYATAVFPAYLMINYPAAMPPGIKSLTTASVIVLGVAIATYVRLSAGKRFGTTPTDYLMLCGVGSLLVFGAIETNSRAVIEAVLVAIVLMYASEIMLGNSPPPARVRLLRFSTLAMLLLIAVRGAL